MKSILISLLIKVIKQLIGSTNWAEIFQAVADAALTPGLSGEQRRQRALDRIETEVEAVGDSLTNLAIEAAVQLIKSKRAG